MWFNADIQPLANKDNPDYSYDIVIDDGRRKRRGYYAVIGDCYHVYNGTLALPCVRWRFARKESRLRVWFNRLLHG